MPPTFPSSCERDTIDIAASLASRCRPGTVLTLEGDLGAGKTTFVKGLVEGLGGDPGQVSSPTFTLIQEYDANHPVAHIDAYRLTGEAEAVQAGLDAYLEGDWMVVVEWPDRIAGLLPTDLVRIRITSTGPDSRRIEVD
jgi:tRNA threonylcarbamoyladenosine biosynthesis protein TsaE